MEKLIFTLLGVVKTMMLQLLNAVSSGNIDADAFAKKFDEVTLKSGLLDLLPKTKAAAVQTAAERRAELIAKFQQKEKAFNADVLGIKGTNLTMPGYEAPNVFVPKVGDDYVLRMELMRVAVGWVKETKMQECLHLFGPTGSGKTTFMLRIAELLNIPVLTYTCHEGTELSDLMGHFVVNENGGMVWKDGPLTLAAEAGWWVIINEVDYANPAVAAGLNDIMEGRGFYIPETNEFIQFSPKTRIIVTSNTAGLGDQTGGSYAGTQTQNLAFLDRFMSVECTYMDAKDEAKLIAADLGPIGNLMPELPAKMVSVANKIRAQFMGMNGAANAIEITMSTRALRRWARLTLQYKDWANTGLDPVQHALNLALINKASAPTRHAIAAIVQAEIGSWTKLMSAQPAQATGT